MILFLAGVGLGGLVSVFAFWVMVFLLRMVQVWKDDISMPRLVPHGPKCLRGALPKGSFFDGEKVRFNCNIPADIEALLIERGCGYERVPDDVVVQPLTLVLHPDAATRGVPVPDVWVDEFWGGAEGERRTEGRGNAGKGKEG